MKPSSKETRPRGVDNDLEAIAVRRCLAGSVEAFEPLVRDHARNLVRLAYHLLGDWDEARDLAQETLARAYLCLDRYDPERPFGTWLCTIASRLAIDRIRRQRTRRRYEDGHPTPDRLAWDPETTLSLRQALARLTPRQRQTVVLCDLHGYTAAEAAEMIGCSASTVRVQRFLARGRLRSQLESVSSLDEALARVPSEPVE